MCTTYFQQSKWGLMRSLLSLQLSWRARLRPAMTLLRDWCKFASFLVELLSLDCSCMQFGINSHAVCLRGCVRHGLREFRLLIQREFLRELLHEFDLVLFLDETNPHQNPRRNPRTEFTPKSTQRNPRQQIHAEKSTPENPRGEIHAKKSTPQNSRHKNPRREIHARKSTSHNSRQKIHAVRFRQRNSRREDHATNHRLGHSASVAKQMPDACVRMSPSTSLLSNLLLWMQVDGFELRALAMLTHSVTIS